MREFHEFVLNSCLYFSILERPPLMWYLLRANRFSQAAILVFSKWTCAAWERGNASILRFSRADRLSQAGISRVFEGNNVLLERGEQRTCEFLISFFLSHSNFFMANIMRAVVSSTLRTKILETFVHRSPFYKESSHSVALHHLQCRRSITSA